MASRLAVVTVAIFGCGFASVDLRAWGQELSRTAIEQLLPAEGNTACFAANFDNRHIRSLRPGQSAKAALYRSHRIRSIVLQLYYDRNQPDPAYLKSQGFDATYTFRTALRLVDRQDFLLSHGECGKLERTASRIRCSVECDGGNLTLERIPNSQSLLIRLAAGEYLRTAPCAGRAAGSLELTGAQAGEEFRLPRAAETACAPIRRWQQRH